MALLWVAMSIDATLEKHLQELLSFADEPAAPAGRLADDAQRLWQRVQHCLAMNLVGPETDQEALHLACYALQLPARHRRALPVGRLGQINLKERAEQAAELMIGAVAEKADAHLIDRTSELLRALPRREPEKAESRLLADVLNLDDFGMTGLILQAMQLAQIDAGLTQLTEGFEKRQQYGYWDVRLKEGFHFEPLRQMARRRLANAAKATEILAEELKEDAGA